MIALADLKRRIDIIDVASRHMRLQRRGTEFWGCCPLHADRTPSFRVDPVRQNFRCFGCGATGDVLDLVAAIDRVDLVEAARRLEAEFGVHLPARRQYRQVPAQEDQAADRKRERAQELWRETVGIAGTIGEHYLIERRRLRDWDEDRLRFHPACPFGREERAPALIAPVNDAATGYVVAIWRIRLNEVGEKIERRGLGPTRGNASRLFWPDGDELAIAEGIEDAVAVYALTKLPCWAALNAGNMALLVIPRRFTEVTAFADSDDVGRRAAHALAGRLREEGRRVRVLRALGCVDPNERLLAQAGAA